MHGRILEISARSPTPFCMDKLMRAEANHQHLKRHVCRHRRAARDAAEDRDVAQATMEAI